MKSEVIKLIDNRDDVTLTTYLIDFHPMVEGTIGRPAIIICPGGAYFHCSDSEGEPIALAFAKMGYHAFVLRYSVYGGSPFDDADTPFEEKLECQHPSPMLDIARAFVYINENAAEWNIDIKRIGICGFSAGGHNCAMYSAHWSKEVITSHFDVDKEVLRPAICIIGYPVTDYLYMRQSVENNKKNNYIFDRVCTAFLGKDWNQDKKILEVSPSRLVDEDVPPTFIWSTFEDNLVPVTHSTLYATELAQKGIPFEIHVFEKGNHGLGMADQLGASSLSQINEDVMKWIGLCECWLKKRFALSLPEKTIWEMQGH